MSTYRQLAVVALAVVAFALAGRMQDRVLTLRKAYHTEATAALEDSPPIIAFTTVALGGFRGVLTDLLWLRATRLQEEGKYFEMVQLADWITKLEPRFDTVWAFHAWNLAYNISVMLPEPPERWRWVSHGIHLLRDEGLRYNPESAKLYWELGWLFQHKLGAPMDFAHDYYRRVLATETTQALGGGFPDYARLPPSGEELRARYKLDPARMQEIDESLGPLDWRLPESHAIYWAWRGLRFASGFEKASLDRMIYQSMAQLFLQGHLEFDAAAGRYELSPRWDFLPQTLRAFDEMLAAHPEQNSFQTAHQNFLREAHEVAQRSGRSMEAAELQDLFGRRYPGDTITADPRVE